jgi:hypothetical protein
MNLLLLFFFFASQVQPDNTGTPADPVHGEDIHLVRPHPSPLPIHQVSLFLYLSFRVLMPDLIFNRTAYKSGWRNETKLTKKKIRLCCEGFAQVEGRCLRKCLSSNISSLLSDPTRNSIPCPLTKISPHPVTEHSLSHLFSYIKCHTK